MQRLHEVLGQQTVVLIQRGTAGMVGAPDDLRAVGVVEGAAVISAGAREALHSVGLLVPLVELEVAVAH